MNKDYFKLFANCIPVKGARRSVICDLQRHRYDLIPNDMFAILQQCKTKPYSEVLSTLNAEDVQTLNEYFDFLIENDYGFWCEEEELTSFPDLDLAFEVPSLITNVIIDVGAGSNHDFGSIYQQLEDLGCKDIQIRFFRLVSLFELDSILKLLANTRIRSVQLIIPFTPELQKGDLIKFCKTHLRVISIIITGSPETSSTLAGVNDYTSLNFIKQKIEGCDSCGVVHEAYFSVDIGLFSEGLQYNTCLNRKLAIDVEGNIKNCPSLTTAFGKADKVTLKTALSHPDFKKLWGINKDQIQGCMDCEFRYICTDCRAYLAEPDNLLSKPLKCRYDPYSATWQNPNS